MFGEGRQRTFLVEAQEQECLLLLLCQEPQELPVVLFLLCQELADNLADLPLQGLVDQCLVRQCLVVLAPQGILFKR